LIDTEDKKANSYRFAGQSGKNLFFNGENVENPIFNIFLLKRVFFWIDRVVSQPL